MPAESKKYREIFQAQQTVSGLKLEFNRGDFWPSRRSSVFQEGSHQHSCRVIQDLDYAKA